MGLFSSKHHRRIDRDRARQERRKIWIALLVGVLFIILLTVIGRLGPRGTDDTAAADAEVTVEAVRQEQAVVTTRFEEIAEKLESLGASDADLEALNALIEEQGVLLRQGRRFYERDVVEDVMEPMVALRDPLMGARLHATSLEAEERAKAAQAAGDLTVAREAYAEAIAQQRRINHEFARSEHRDTFRLTMLEETQRELEVRPILDEIKTLHTQAETAEAEKAFLEAESAYTRALALQREVNRAHRGSRFADPILEEQMAFQLRSLAVQVAFAQVEALQQEGDDAMAEEAFALAEDAYSRALTAFDRLTAEHPDAARLRGEARTRLQIRQQTAASAGPAQELATEVAALEAALGRQQPHAARPHIANAVRLARVIQRQYPESEHYDAELTERLRYLQAMGDSLFVVWQRLQEQLVPVPGEAGLFMLDREVSQAFYLIVTGENPAANEALDQPIVSVRWDQAVDFCQRLSWITGQVVRLPSQAELTSALGDPALEVVAARSWHSQNAQALQAVASQEPVANGFYDLLGNAAEWTEDVADEPAERWVWGGSVRDNPMRLNRVPTEARPAANPSSFLGFRLVIEGWGA